MWSTIYYYFNIQITIYSKRSSSNLIPLVASHIPLLDNN